MPLSHGGIVHLDPSLEERLRSFLKPEDVSEPLLNLVRAALAAHEHAFHFPNLPKEAFLHYMGVAWESGAHQLKVIGGEVEGGIINEYGLACNFASHLALFGERDGLLPKEPATN